MFELMEKNQKDVVVIENDMLKNATNKINQYHTITKRAILGISMILADIADKPKEYLENSGFNSIAEYAEEIFGYKKAYTYKLIKISKFIAIKDIEGKDIPVKSLIDDKIDADYWFDVIKDSDDFEFSPSQMLELIPLTNQQIEDNLKELDSSLTCKELRSIVKDIVNPPIEIKGEESKEDKEQEDNKEEEKEKIELTDKDRILQMLEICSNIESEDIKTKIVNVFQKSLKLLER